jgi:hypothetical protein
MRFLVLALVCLSASTANAETPELAHVQKRPATRRTAAVVSRPILLQLLRHSGQIFAGTVLQVQHSDAGSPSSLATTTIQFRVDEAVRGVHKGQIFEMKEWGGLWQAGEHYRSGEHLLLFLYPPSKLGLTSPVAHSLGRFRVDTTGRIVISSRNNMRPQRMELRRLLAALHAVEGE